VEAATLQEVNQLSMLLCVQMEKELNSCCHPIACSFVLRHPTCPLMCALSTQELQLLHRPTNQPNSFPTDCTLADHMLTKEENRWLHCEHMEVLVSMKANQKVIMHLENDQWCCGSHAGGS